MIKILKGKCFANVEETKQKMAEALKGIKMDTFKNHLELLGKMSEQVYCVTWRVL